MILVKQYLDRLPFLNQMQHAYVDKTCFNISGFMLYSVLYCNCNLFITNFKEKLAHIKGKQGREKILVNYYKLILKPEYVLAL